MSKFVTEINVGGLFPMVIKTQVRKTDRIEFQSYVNFSVEDCPINFVHIDNVLGLFGSFPWLAP